MIPLAVPQLSGNEAKYLQECISSTFVSSVGPFVTRFEEMITQSAGASGAVATSSGTTGLHLALHAVGVKPGDLVAIPTFTFIASANAVSHCGAIPWLFDVTPADWCIDVDQLERVLASELRAEGSNWIHARTGRRLAALMPVYTLGYIPNMDRIQALSKRYGIPVVADAACAMGAQYREKDLGPLADASVFSFNGNKTITAGGGGAVVSMQPDLLKCLRHLGSTARVGKNYDHDAVGFNYRITNLQAAVGCAQMERLPEFFARKRAIRARYNAAWQGLKGVQGFPTAEGEVSADWFSGLVLDRSHTRTVPQLVEQLRELGIEAKPFWKPIHLQQPYAEAPRADTMVSDSLWERILTLPCSTGLTEHEQAQVIEAVRRILA